MTRLWVLLAVEGDVGHLSGSRVNRMRHERKAVVRYAVSPLPVVAQPQLRQRRDVDDNEHALLVSPDLLGGGHKAAEWRGVAGGDTTFIPFAGDGVHVELARSLDGAGVELERGAPDLGAGNCRRQRRR